MGLVSECIRVELGLRDKAAGAQRAGQTLKKVVSSWPRESTHGFFQHFTSRDLEAKSEYSTIDTAIMAAGALFAGSYFGGEVQDSARELFNLTDWSAAVKGSEDPTMATTVDEKTGAMQGHLKPYNEYYIVALMAMIQDPAPSSKASLYFKNFFGLSGRPEGRGGFPVHPNYWGFELLSDHGGFVSSFIPQFCWYLTKNFQQNKYYSEYVFPNWLQADMAYWTKALGDDSRVWGKAVKGIVWGAGAGPQPTGYGADSIDNSQDLTFSAPIMAGFLPAARSVEMKNRILLQLMTMYKQEICAYHREVGSGNQLRILWRCSVKHPTWRADYADSIDYSSFVLGYSSIFLDADFFETYAAGVALEDDQGTIISV
eukprot:TRINITY_DN12089_c0_g1_i13.p1 TRINITY_DN12089_c0_g1~~TRINITY_DN12089_c0_g1_i13.p1  ORF type:complete len:371 (+),score=55.94 TRINITY_DN12089_c0_g1_i13:323-1435(+)